MPSLTLTEIAALLNVPAPAGRAERSVTGMATLAEAGPNDLSFLGSDAYLKQFAATKAAAVVVQKRVKLPRELPPSAPPVFVVDDADLAVARILQHFAPPVPRPPVGHHASAVVAPSASVGEGARIGPNVFVGDESRIGRNVVLHPGVYIGAMVQIGDDCELFPNVVLRERVHLGSRVVVHAGSVIGSDGFGYRWDGTRHTKVPQIGTVAIEDDVEIGSCVCIDRAKFSTTRVGRGTKIDNLVQVGHNVVIGPHCIIVGQVGLAGSVTLGAGVVLGGQSAIRDHITLGDGSMVAACAGVAEDIDPKMIVSGLPALPHRQSLREQAALRRLPDLVAQVRKLQEELEQLKRSQS
ncbi:MAG TPA: UDP-3-O-(3-hydroxymyristoyl)glucosamine N-acyltransferase [Tepidisphaeraceae bacterium]|nr:UDP-3-O-(3-hydroxymyristoyl)glucosamine N-acyltransferase [Tepidisphaeraceae bacterium]